MAVPPAPDGSVTGPGTSTSTAPTAERTGRGSASPVFRLGLLVLLVLVLVASVAVTGYLVATRTSGAAGGTLDRVGGLLAGDDAIAEEREAVMSVAQQFMLRVNTYGPEDLTEDGTTDELGNYTLDVPAGCHTLFVPGDDEGRWEDTFLGDAGTEPTDCPAADGDAAQTFTVGEDTTSLTGKDIHLVTPWTGTGAVTEEGDPSTGAVVRVYEWVDGEWEQYRTTSSSTVNGFSE